MIQSLATGEPFLGEYQPLVALPQTHYVSLDRPPEELEAKLATTFAPLRGKITYESLFPKLEQLRGIEAVLQTIQSERQPELLVLDGIGFIVEGKKLIEQRQIGILMSNAYNWCSRHRATMTLAHHTAKSKMGQGYTNAREAAAGSGAWAQTAGLSTYLAPAKPDDIENPERIVNIMQNQAAGKRFEVTMTETGLVKVNLCDREAQRIENSSEFSRDEVRNLFNLKDYSSIESMERAVTRQIDKWVAEGFFKKAGHGRFVGSLPTKV